MEFWQTVIILGRLVLGAAASFLAIMLLSKTRDTAWIFVIVGTIIAYVETVNSILNILGMGTDRTLKIGSFPLISAILPALSTMFYVAAFAVMVFRKYRRH
jgi:hypothetical protein